jgi:hypothetical protein
MANAEVAAWEVDGGSSMIVWFPGDEPVDELLLLLLLPVDDDEEETTMD